MKNVLTCGLALLLGGCFSGVASAQWDYGQNAIDNMIESRIDIRKTRARMKARRGAKTKSSRTSSRKTVRPAAKSVSLSKPKVAPLPSNVAFHRDTYQDFHLDDSKGYRVDFVFTSTSGKVLRRAYNFTYYNSVAEFADIPVGKYRVTAQGIYSGKKYPIHLGSEDGTTTEPLGGNFAPSIGLEVKPGKDQWGTKTLLTVPESLHVRVIE